MSRHLLVSLFLFTSYCLYAQEDNSERDRWLLRYFSVSYPLKSLAVNSPFGIRKDPFTGKTSFHSGLDLKAANEDVMSMFDGMVEKTGYDERSGYYVILTHGSYRVSYCHLSTIGVEKGQDVLAGDVVAVSGNSGRSTGAHLHITVRKNDEVVDPQRLLTYIKEVRAEAVLALGGILLSSIEVQSPVDFIRRYAQAAMEQQQRYGIPASVTLSQMAYESGWGNSELARKGNNFFGIKCTRKWLADGKPYSVHDDDRKGEKFCNYASVDESVEHHSRLLMADRYKACRKHKPTDFHGWLTALKKAGYATCKDYVEKCETIIRRFKLYRYDELAVRSA